MKQGGLTSKLLSILYDRPSSSGAKATGIIPFNTRVFLDRSYPGPFYRATTRSGKQGYLAGEDVKTNLPEPSAQLHFVGSGETPIGIAERYFKDLVEPGQDLRFYVNVLEYVNRGEGRRGIYKPSPDAHWKKTRALANYLIWIPGKSFAKRLKGVVKSGSITGGLWARVKGLASAVADFVTGVVGFVGGLIAGALSSVKDLFVGLVELVKIVGKTFWSALTGALASDAKSLWEKLPSWKQIKEMVSGWLGNFKKKWHAPDVWDRWYFRGWVVGYAVLEAVMLIFTGGALTAAKWGGRAGKLAATIAKLPVVRTIASKLPKAKKAVDGLTKGLKARLGRRALTKLLPKLSENAQKVAKLVPEDELGRLAKLHASDPKGVDDLLQTYYYKFVKKGADGPNVTSFLDDAMKANKAIRARGFPYGFSSKAAYDAFKKKINDALDKFGLPPGEVGVHGSAARSTAAKLNDIDVAVKVSEQAFNELLDTIARGTTRRKILGMVEDARRTGKIPAFLFPRKGGTSFGRTVYGSAGDAYSKLQVSVIKKGGGFDLGPWLPF